jgi:hypothetical protein
MIDNLGCEFDRSCTAGKGTMEALESALTTVRALNRHKETVVPEPDTLGSAKTLITNPFYSPH